MQWGFDWVFGATVGIAAGRDLEFIAGQEVDGEAADFLAGVVRDVDYFAVATSFRINFINPSIVFFSICKAGKPC